MADRSGRTIQSVDTAVRIVDVVSRSDGVDMDELSDRFDLSRSSLHHYLTSLENAGYLDRSDGTIHLGDALLRLGGRRRSEIPWFSTARRSVDDLSSTLEATVSIEIPIGDTTTTIYVSPQEVQQEYTSLGVEEQHSDSVVAEVLAGEGDGSQVYWQTYPVADLQARLADIGNEPAPVESQDGAGESIVRVVRAIEPLDEALGLVSVWIPSHRWETDKQQVQEELVNTISIVEVNATYADWPGGH
jgi:DNA-binding transcriptional ArsR family regulator